MMPRTRPQGWITLVALGGIGLAAGCSGGSGGSVVYDTGYVLGAVIDTMLVQPGLAPEVTIEVVGTDATTGIVTLKANADATDLPLTYQWEQVAGQDVTISKPAEATTEVHLPLDVPGEFVFRVTVTDAKGREGTDGIQLDLQIDS